MKLTVFPTNIWKWENGIWETKIHSNFLWNIEIAAVAI